jgi:hypothetical protein
MQSTYSFVEPDTRGRVALGRWLRQGRQYIVQADDATGTVTLEPVGLVLSEDAAADLIAHPQRVADLLSRARTISTAGAPDGLVGLNDVFDNLSRDPVD